MSAGRVTARVMRTHVHVIPVDPSLSVEDAWRELCIFGHRITYTGDEAWGVVGCDGAECRFIERQDTS